MKWRTWKEARFDLLCNVAIPIVGGGAGAMRGSEWHRLYQFLFVDNQNWTIAVILWLFMVGFICLMAEAPTVERRRSKRILGVIFISLWIWGVTISAAMINPQPPIFQQHIDLPAHWWKSGNF